jgi:hypothetical protein
MESLRVNLLHVYRPLLALSHSSNCAPYLWSASWHFLYGTLNMFVVDILWSASACSQIRRGCSTPAGIPLVTGLMTIFQLKKTNKVCCAIRITGIFLSIKKLEIACKIKLICIYECKEVPKKFIRNVLKTILTERGSRYLYFLERRCVRIWAL